MVTGLDGDVVRLRAATPADFDVLYEIEADLASWEQRTPRAPRPMTRADFESRFTTSLSDDAGVTFVVDLGDAVIGQCEMFAFDMLARSAEVGIALHPDAQGKGYGTDALRALVRFGFERRNLRRLHLRVLASNAAAIASYRKAGFVEEGRHRESAWVSGSYQDEITMGLLRAEWLPAVTAG
jgi:RimJ/RimL family protein N-acetyltransferase